MVWKYVFDIRFPLSANEYKKEINRDNPLGTKGHLAESYGELMHDMWSKWAVIAPKRFKVSRGRGDAFSSVKD